MTFRYLLVVLSLLLSTKFTHLTQAHELRPAFLSITEVGDAEYRILWKTPALGEKQLALKAIFPISCTAFDGQRRVQENKFAIETWALTCPQSLRGQAVKIGGLEKTLTDVLVKTIWLDGDSFTARLTPDKSRLEFVESRKIDNVIATYFRLGFDHILGGIDHLLFVLAVMLLITRGRKLFFAVTAFTLGHSLTLALATLDIVRLNPGFVELLIAMSIVLMAYEAVRRLNGHSGLTLEYPWLVTFTFGLLHGFGFAGALRNIGLPHTDIPVALLFFNLGVEAGQIAFMLAVWILTLLLLIKHVSKQKIPRISTSYLIGTVAVFWTLQRAAIFIG